MKFVKQNSVIVFLFISFALLLSINISEAAEEHKLYAGWASVDITPDKPVALLGQKRKRISERVNDPLMATVLALETRGKNGEREQAIMVSCDLIWTRREIQKRLQSLISKKLDDFDAEKLFLNATHTHTAPGMIDNAFSGLYDVSNDKGVMKPSEYTEFFLPLVADAVVKAWRNRKPSGMSWCLGNAVLGHNRRTVKFDSSARMYGVSDEGFSHYEGKEDHRVEMLFFWAQNSKLTGIVINFACTAQITGGSNFVSADFWHEVRVGMKKKYGENLFIFPQCGTAGDQVPITHEFVYKRAEEIMLKRKGISWRQEFANRIIEAVDKVMPIAKDDIKDNLIFKHTVAKVNLPTKQPAAQPFYTTDSVNPAEFHVIRLGDIAIATNPFEIFIDYGIRIKARSRAILTFLVQLSCHHSGYLPTARAAEGGGYSADEYIVTPEGGQMLVNETVKRINEMWE